jgi:hypothetical protein
MTENVFIVSSEDTILCATGDVLWFNTASRIPCGPEPDPPKTAPKMVISTSGTIKVNATETLSFQKIRYELLNNR